MYYYVYMTSYDKQFILDINILVNQLKDNGDKTNI